MRQKIILLILAFLLPITAFAWSDDFSGGYDFEVDSIYYEIISQTPPKVRVCSKAWWKIDEVKDYSSNYSGDLMIPCDVTYDGVTFTVTDICWNAFMGCSDLKSITIPASITNITITSYWKDIDYGVLTSGSNGVKSIKVVGNSIFDSRNDCNAIIETTTNKLIAGCDNTTIPNSITSIGTSAFVNCKGLSNLQLPNTITEIGESAFAGCSNLGAIEIPNSVTYIGSCAFMHSGLISLVLPDSISSISSGTFYSCNNLKNIEIPNSVTAIERSSFYACVSLSNVTIPNSVTIIGNNAFDGCRGFTSVTIPNSVTSIGTAAFSCYDSNIVDVTCEALIPPSIYYYSGSSFNTFNCYNQATLYIPRDSYDAYRNANGWRQFRTIQSLADLEIDNLYFNFTSDSTVCVTYKTENYNSYSGDVVIPESINYDGKDYIVNAIDDKAFYNCSGLTSITIPNTITTIGSYAFYGCGGLTSVDIPNSISIISDDAFRNCTGLLNVNIPDSLQTIGNNSFMGCTGLASLTIGKSVASIGNSAFNNCNNLKELTWNAINCSSNGNMSTSNIETVTIGPEVVVLPNNFVSGSKISEVIIPNSVTWISFSAFQNCGGLSSIEIPNSVTTIDNNAFYHCTGLSDVSFGNSVYYIGSQAFHSCSGLTSITIGPQVQTISNLAFASCTGLERIDLPNSLINIGYGVFYNCNRLSSITVPSRVVEIGEMACYNCSGLTCVTIGNSVSTIGSNAFLNCNGLSKVVISNLASWSKISFENNTANPLYYSHHLYLNDKEIKHLVIPDGVTSIGDYVFINGTSFIDLTLPVTLESIGNNSFEGCKRLTDITLGSSISSIGSGTFKDCTAINSVTCMASTPPAMAEVDCFDSDCYDWATLYVPGDKVEVYNSTLYWNKFANSVGTGIEVDGIYYLFNLDTSEATVTFKDRTYCTYSGEVVIPENVNHDGIDFIVTAIGEAAFAYCDELTSVILPNTVTSIGDYAFMYCENLPSIDIPNTVASIGDNAFDGCSCFNTIEIPNSVMTIGDMAFQGCTNVTDLTIGSGVTQIGAKAFNYCNALNTVTCKGNKPPTMDNSNCFTSYGYQAKLLVPHASIDDYKSANYWYKFAAIEGFDVSEPGDVNGDGGINISDVTSLIDLLLSGGETSAGADVNGDGQVNISDVTALIDRLLSGN